GPRTGPPRRRRPGWSARPPCPPAPRPVATGGPRSTRRRPSRRTARNRRPSRWCSAGPCSPAPAPRGPRPWLSSCHPRRKVSTGPGRGWVGAAPPLVAVAATGLGDLGGHVAEEGVAGPPLNLPRRRPVLRPVVAHRLVVRHQDGDHPRVAARLGVGGGQDQHHLPEVLGDGDRAGLADHRGRALLALAADAVRPGGEEEHAALLRQSPAV